ncbi:MAG: hypothetical protein ABIR55_18025, partial [Burkholderiaceae bacterium]
SLINAAVTCVIARDGPILEHDGDPGLGRQSFTPPCKIGIGRACLRAIDTTGGCQCEGAMQ